MQAHESITLDPADFDAFLAALDEPVQANAALSRAFDRHSEQVER
ncbi:MAG: type II toxin -antitoxin system TacA 1-like antitoxin [Methylobacter sp.]